MGGGNEYTTADTQPLLPDTMSLNSSSSHRGSLSEFTNPTSHHHHLPHPPHHHDDSPAFGHGGHGNAKVNVKYAVWNLFNDVLSPGTVALPLYVYQAGLGTGIFLIIAFGFLTGYTLEDIYLLYMKFGKKSYPELCDFVFGKVGYAIVCLCIFCFNFGGLCAQLMMFGVVVPDILIDLFGKHDFFIKRNLILCGCCIFLPISLLKDIAKYTFTSFISITCITCVTILVVFRLVDKKAGDFAPPDNDPYAIIHLNVLEALGGLAYIYVCHDLNFNVINSLENPTPRRYRRVVVITMAGTALACTLIGVSGYLLFYGDVQPNILDSFPQKDLVATIGRVILAVDITITIPFSCFMPRISILAGISAIGPRSKAFAKTQTCFLIVSLIVLAMAVTIAILVNNLGDVFELVGGISACALAFLIPPLLMMKQIGLRNLDPFKRVMTVGVFICGLIIFFGTTFDVFYQ